MSVESEVRDTLRSAADGTRVPEGLAERLISGSTRPGATETSLPFGGPRRHPWITPLVAAAVVILVVGAVTLTAVLAGRSHRHEPATPVVTPTVSIPAPSPTSTPQSSGPPSSPSTSARTAAPADFRAADVQFRDALHATAVGIGLCRAAATGSCQVTVIASDDGGASWYRLGAPAGLHPMFPTSDSDGSCDDNGAVLGPCVNHVFFADAEHGYVWGVHSMYMTADGGRTWTDQGTGVGFGGAQDVAIGGGLVYRVVPIAQGSVASVPARLQVSTVGGTRWTDVSPTGSLSWASAVVATPGAVLVADVSTDQAASPAVRLYRSTDAGGSWTLVGSADLVTGLAAADDGRLAALTALGSECTMTSVTSGGSVDGTPVRVGCTPSSNLKPGPATLVGLSGDGHRILVAGSAQDPTQAYPVSVYRIAAGSTQPVPVATLTIQDPLNAGEARFAGDTGTILLGGSRVAVSADGGATWRTISV